MKEFIDNGKLLIAGNGESAADSEHIAGELMKKFKIPRSVPDDLPVYHCLCLMLEEHFFGKVDL